MPLSKTNPCFKSYLTEGNPYQEWWLRHDEKWIENRATRWPTISRAIRKNIKNASALMPGFKNFYLTGEPCDGLDSYIPYHVRLALMPFESTIEARKALESCVYPHERHLRVLAPTILYGSSITNEGLASIRADDEGINKLCFLGEAAFPETFSAADADSTDDRDLEYFQERGKGSAAKPLPFLRNYLHLGSRFMASEVSSDGNRILVNTSDHVREYFMSCLRYMEETKRCFQPDDNRGDFFAEKLTRFLTEVLFFEELYPSQDETEARFLFARGWRSRLDKSDIPVILKQECDRLLSDRPEIQARDNPASENPNAHLKFFRNSSSQYVVKGSPDAESWISVIANFKTVARRNTVARLIGEPGRPPDGSSLRKTESSIFNAVERLPLPYRVRYSGKTAVYVQFVDWHDNFNNLEPLVDALQMVEAEQAFITLYIIEDDEPEQRIKIDGGKVSEFRRSSSPLWKELKRISEINE